MPQLKKTSLGNNPTGKTPSSEAIDRARKQRWAAFIIASVVVILILIIVGVSYYFSENARYRRLTIVTIDNTAINMDYFLMRTQLAGADPIAMLGQLTDEQLIKIEAPRYGIEVSPEDINQELRRIARGESETISETEFKEWYRQLLNEIGLSDSVYKEFVATSLLAAHLHEYLAERVPPVAEQIYLHSALLSIEEVAEIWKKEDAREDVDKLISEIWQDKQSEGKVDDLGWLPRSVLPPGFDEVAFNLAIGDVSKALAYTDPDSNSEEISYHLLMVSEKADAREVDENPLQILKAQALDAWLLEEIKLHKVEWNLNSEIYAWVNWQLAKK